MGPQILIGDVRNKLYEINTQSIQTCITSPPYWGLRDYGNDGQIGLEQSPEEYVAELVAVFREVRRILKDDGTLWLNLGDSFAGGNYRSGGVESASTKQKSSAGTLGFMGKTQPTIPVGLKPKDLVGIPWRVAFALQADGWYLRQDIIWAKPNPMPESVTDRCTKSHEYMFLLSKSRTYYFDNKSIKEPATTGYKSSDFIPSSKKDLRDETEMKTSATGASSINRNNDRIETRNKRDVWTIPTKPYKGAHFAVMPEALVQPCIMAGSREGDFVLDPFMGSGTVAKVALDYGRRFIGVELNPEYAKLAYERIGQRLL